MPLGDLSTPVEKNPLMRDHAYAGHVFASDHAQYPEDIRLPNNARSTTFETVARSLIHRRVVTGFVKKHCREEPTKGSPGYTDFERLHRHTALARSVILSKAFSFSTESTRLRANDLPERMPPPFFGAPDSTSSRRWARRTWA